MRYHVPIANRLSYESIPRNQQLGLEIHNHCDFPSRTLVIDTFGNCFVCACEAWLPITVGNILEFDRLEAIWDSPVSKSLQKDIDQGKFTHCAVDRCGVLDQHQRAANYCGRTPTTGPIYYVSINLDDSCNLACPSCRSSAIMNTHGPEFERKSNMVQHLVRLLIDFPYACHLVLCGNGDPLASNIFRPLLHDWPARPDQTMRLFTNGLLLEKQLAHNPIVQNITQYFISIDAGSAAIYQQVRQPGRFNILLRNFDWLRNTVSRTQATVLLKFVLQDANHEDMENFVQLCQTYGFQGVINRLEDWGTWSSFKDQDVIGNSLHPNHARAMRNLKDIYQRYHESIQFNSSLRHLARG